jgi:hypothetical protein
MSATIPEELHVVAAEELAGARRLRWRELARITPWADAYTGFTPSGQEVEIERSYLWANGEAGDVLCEVVVRAPPPNGGEAQASCVIAKGG